MRCSLGLVMWGIAATFFIVGTAAANETQGKVANDTPRAAETPSPEAPEALSEATIRTHENIETPLEERQRAAAAAQAASAEEQQVSSRVRGLQLLMQKEEQALAQRLAYAAQIREQGLTKNDQKMLDQAERIERAALDYYQKRCQQFEQTTISNSPSSSNSRASQSGAQRNLRSSTPSNSRYQSSSRARSRR